MVRLYASLASFLEECLKSFVTKRLNHALNCKLLINTCQSKVRPLWQIGIVIGGGFRLESVVGLELESVAGLELESVAGFIGIRSLKEDFVSILARTEVRALPTRTEYSAAKNASFNPRPHRGAGATKNMRNEK